MEESGADIEAVAATEVPRFALDGLVMDDDVADKRDEWSGIKVGGAVVVLPGRHGGVQGRLAENIQGDLGLRDQLTPQVVGGGGADASNYADEMDLQGTDDAFGGVAAMDIQEHELESSSPVLCDDAAVFLSGLVVDDLVVIGVTALLEFGHDTVVRRNAVAVMAGLERLDE